jgi:hypothetical protein
VLSLSSNFAFPLWIITLLSNLRYTCIL